MQFKLISIDSDKPNKIELKTGTHIFGRGKLLSVDDKRISRKHGQLEVTDDSLVVTALHQNPCFYRQVGTTEIEVLKQNNSVSLSSGDRLGLLLGSYWFEVLHCLPSSENVQEDSIPMNSAYGEETDNEIDSRLEVTNIESNNNDKMDTESGTANDDQASQEETLNKTQNDVNKDCETEDDKNEAKENVLSNENEKNMDVEEEHNGQNVSENSDPPPRNDSASTYCGEESQSLLATNENQEEDCNENQQSVSQNSQHKRPHDSDEQSTDEVKKIKTEPEVGQEIKTEPQAGSSSSSNSDKDKAASPPQAVLRERCMYGASCYRRNPAHRAQFSHPRDADWGAGPRAPCPWGAACVKRDPRHWRDHDHPPGKLPPPTPPTPPAPYPHPGQRIVHRHGNIFYINAQTVNFYDDHFEAEDSDGNSVDYDYEF